jgi:uncharacterized protein
LAVRVFTAVRETMTWTDGGGMHRLGHSLCGGRLQKSAMLDDYANMANAALALHTATGDTTYLAQAEAWVETAHRYYSDSDSGGYFFTAEDARDIIVRTKSVNDSAVPSGNGSMVFALARLTYLTGSSAYRLQATTTVAALEVEAMKSFPHGATLLNAYELLETAVQVVIVGTRGDTDTETLLRVVLSMSLPNLVLDVVPDSATLPHAHPAYGKTRIDDKATAYICRGPVCSPPQTKPEDLQQLLAA